MRLELICVGLLQLAASDDIELSGLEDSFDNIETNSKEEVKYDLEKVDLIASIPLSSNVILTDRFQSDDLESSGWYKLNPEQYNGEWSIGEHPTRDYVRGDKKLIMKSYLSFHGLGHQLSKEWKPSDKLPLFFSFEVSQPTYHNCGGGYIKLYNSKEVDTDQFNGSSPYSIMFGPDHCGGETNKVHFIVEYKAPNGERAQEQLVEAITLPSDKQRSHIYGFELYPDSKLVIRVDDDTVFEGNLKTAMSKGFSSPEMIDDPSDPVPEGWEPEPEYIPDSNASKPDDWDESQPEMIPDPNAQKPEGWLDDEPLYIPNMDAVKPEDWNDQEDGDWIRPLRKNSKCIEHGCGVWKAPEIPNPLFKGIWQPPMVKNPDYKPHYIRRQISNPYPYSIENPYDVIDPFNAIAFELWTVEQETTFDDIIVTTDKKDVQNWIEKTWKVRRDIEIKNEEIIQKSETEDAEENGKSNKASYLTAGIAATAVVGAIGAFMFRKTKCGAAAKSDKKDDDKKSADDTKKDDDKKSADDTKKDEEKKTEEPHSETIEEDEDTSLRRRKD